VVEARRRLFGEQNSATLAGLSGLGAVYLSQGRYRDAEPLLVKVLETQTKILASKIR
jgi:hypothetical protein